MPLSFHLEWSQSLAAGLGGLSLARESGWFCAWDAQGWIYLFNSQGQRQGQVRFSEPLAQAALADDGSCLLAAGNAGKLRCYNPDLSTQWESDHKGGLLSLALDPLGQMAAVADREGGLLLLDRTGKKIAQTQSPRPLHHLALVPTVKRLVGAADFGLLAGFDEAAQILWRETPVVHVGGLAVDATGDKILLACFSEGVAWFGGDGKLRKNFATPAPCGKVCQSFAGDVILAGGFGNQVMILNGEGALLGQHQLAHTIQATALDPLGRELCAALSDGTVVKYRLDGLSK